MSEKYNELGLNKEYLDLELPSSMEDYQLWEAYRDRKIIFNDEVDSTIINKAILWIRKWNEEDDRAGLVGDDRKDITLILCSNGGDVVAGLALVDAIRASKTKVIGIAIGVAASMGIVILSACHVRLAYTNTVLLIHDGQLGIHGTSNKAKNTMKFYDRLDEIVKNVLLENTTISPELYELNMES